MDAGAAQLAADHLAWPTKEIATAVATSSSAVVRARARGAALLATLAVTAEEVVAVSRRRRDGPAGTEKCLG